MLLRLRPDTVRRFLLRETQTSTSLTEGSPTAATPQEDHHPCYSGLQVQGAATSRFCSSPCGEVPAIYLRLLSPTGSSGLPSDVGRATLIMSVYMTLQLLRRTARHVTMRLVGSYPTFSPLPRFP